MCILFLSSEGSNDYFNFWEQWFWKGAKSKLPSDKAATRKDAEGVTGAEMRNDPHLTTYPTGVAASVAAAARINQSKWHQSSFFVLRSQVDIN